jgi:hypothetical protein
VQLGFGSQLAATKDLIVQAGHGGDAGLGQTAGTLTVSPRPPLCELGLILTRLVGGKQVRQAARRSLSPMAATCWSAAICTSWGATAVTTP